MGFGVKEDSENLCGEVANKAIAWYHYTALRLNVWLASNVPFIIHPDYIYPLWLLPREVDF